MNIELKKWDNCYTFMLKYLDIFINFYKVESNDFIELFNKDYNLNNFENNDVIVWETLNEEPSYCNREINEGVLVSKKYPSTIHFGIIYLNKYLIDLTYSEGYNLIRFRNIEELNFENENSKVFKIQYKDIKLNITN